MQISGSAETLQRQPAGCDLERGGSAGREKVRNSKSLPSMQLKMQTVMEQSNAAQCIFTSSTDK